MQTSSAGLSRRRSSRRGWHPATNASHSVQFDPEHHLVGFAYDPEATIRRVPRNAFGLLYIVRHREFPSDFGSNCHQHYRLGLLREQQQRRFGVFDERDAGEIGHGHIGAIERHNA